MKPTLKLEMRRCAKKVSARALGAMNWWRHGDFAMAVLGGFLWISFFFEDMKEAGSEIVMILHLAGALVLVKKEDGYY